MSVQCRSVLVRVGTYTPGMPFILLTKRQGAVVCRMAVAGVEGDDWYMPTDVAEALKANATLQASGGQIERPDGTVVGIKPVSWEVLGGTWAEVLASWNDRYGYDAR